MRFLIRLKNERGFLPKDARMLAFMAYKAVKVMGADVGNLRVSSSAVEFDLLMNSKDVKEDAVNVLVKNIGGLLTVRDLDRPLSPKSEEAVSNGILLFNEERYWESHESFESAWLTASGDKREVFQAIILLAAALVHLQKDEYDVAISVMRRADAKLSDHGTLFQVNLAKLKTIVTQALVEGRPTFFKLPINES